MHHATNNMMWCDWSNASSSSSLFNVRERVGWFLHMRHLHLTRSKAQSWCKPNSTKSLIPSLPTCLYLLLHSFKTSTCWNPFITILSPTWPNYHSLLYLMHSMPNRLLSSALAVLVFTWIPHIHPTVNRSVLSKLALSSTFIVQVSLAYPKALWIQALYTSLYSLLYPPLMLALEPVP